MHYQLAPAAEVKVVRCIRGALWDAILDLRPDSPTFGKWFGAELNAENRLMMYVPRGFAHAILTLDATTPRRSISSAISMRRSTSAACAGTIPRFAIGWPIGRPRFRAKDAAVAGFRPALSRRRAARGHQVRVLLTGASSFTGYWFARELAAAGHQVVAPLRGRGQDYSGVRAERVARLAAMRPEIVGPAPSATTEFVELLAPRFRRAVPSRRARGDYRSPDFDILARAGGQHR